MRQTAARLRNTASTYRSSEGDQQNTYKSYSVERSTRVKTLAELNAEKEELLRKQREKAAMDRQIVLDNIHLLRLREMFPDAKIECSEHIMNLIEAYQRRNLVATEIQKELALAKMLERKPRPGKIIRGEAVVRQSRVVYLDGWPHNMFSDKDHFASEEDDSTSVDIGRYDSINGEQERPQTQQFSVYLDQKGPDSIEPCTKHGPVGRQHQHQKKNDFSIAAGKNETIALGTLQPQALNIKEPLTVTQNTHQDLTPVAASACEDSQVIQQESLKEGLGLE